MDPRFVTTDLEPLHDRRYQVDSYRVDDTTIRVVGTIVDQKPPGMYIPGDPEPLTIHEMSVAFDVDVTSMQIVDAGVGFESHPNPTCPDIIEHYDKLIGLSVARGFNRRLRELFGGPRACSHTTALIQAMAPVVVQSLWSLRVTVARDAGEVGPFDRNSRDADAVLATNLNTCHVWQESGETVARVRRGEPGEAPIWISRRFAELGRDVSEWSSPG